MRAPGELRWHGLAAAGVVVVMLAVAVLDMVPPTVVPADGDPAEFSAERAFAHVRAIAAEPRPIGSPGSAAARDYLVGRLEDMGLSPYQPSITVPDYFGRADRVEVVDIVARIEGTDSTGSIVLMAHYDTVPGAPGANDDATAVAAVVETARALLAGPPLRNDVILLITDGEEPSPRYGSTAFLEYDPLAADVRLAINLEAIGTSGVSQLTEVDGNEGWLISQYGLGVSRPAGSSVLDDISELIGGSNTDVAPFRDRGIAAFEFAYLTGSPIYHTAGDDIASVHQGSLQHHGTQTLGLARHFGGLDLAAIGGGGREVFFTVAGRIVVHYPAWLGIVLALLAGAMLVMSVWMDRRRELDGVGGVLAGAGWLVLIGIGAGLIVAIVWRLLVAWLWGAEGPGAAASLWWMIALIAIAAGSTMSAYRWVAGRVGSAAIEWASVTAWWALGMIASVAMPGAGYLFVWPVLAAVVAAAFRPVPRWVMLAAVSAPALVLTLPVLDTFFQMGLPRPGNLDSQIPEVMLLVGFLASLVAVLLAPHLSSSRPEA